MQNPVGEPFVPDDWLDKVEGRLRKRYPQIPETAQFATYVQPELWHKVDGLDRLIPETAVFLVKLPSPRDQASGQDAVLFDDAHKGMDVIERGAELLKIWKERERQFKHYVGMPDPLESAFETVLKSLATKHKNLRMLSN